MSDNSTHETTEIAASNISKFREPAAETETLIDIENRIFVRFGLPLKGGAIVVPNEPHIFIANELSVRDEDHQEPVILKDITVLIGHGIRDNQDKWKFTNGQDVRDTLLSYNRYAKSNNLPEVEFLAVCNKDNATNGLGIITSESNVSTIAHPAGTEISVSGILEEDGQSKLYVNTRGWISDLDTLKTKQEIKILS